MSGLRAVLVGASLAVLTTIVPLSLAMAGGVVQFTGPQLLTASALWIVSGYYAGFRAGEAGTLHGLVAGFAGALIMFALLSITQDYSPTPFVENLLSRGALLLGVIGGFWGAVGGVFSDIGRAVKAKRARRSKEATEAVGDRKQG